jgi:hypothetical protein
MTESLDRLTEMADPSEVLSSISKYDATQIIKHLRQARKALWNPNTQDLARAGAYLRTAHRIAEVLHAQNPDDKVVTTVFAAVIKDGGEYRRAGELLAARLRDDCNHYYLNVVGSVLWWGGYRTSARFAFDLAQQYQDSAGTFTFTNETLESLRARLRGTWLPNDAFYRLSEEGKQPLLADEELAKLETPLPIPGLAGYTLRPIKSKRQLARAANQLRNCLNSYLTQIVHGTTLLFSVENDGTPVEAIEVNPATRKVVQWKGPSNSAPNAQTRPIIERVLARTAIPAELPTTTTKTGVVTDEAPF